MADLEAFFHEDSFPETCTESENKAKEFVKYHEDTGIPVALVTSGGTKVPLEGNTVRYIDNFSIGTRGAVSAEFFLQHGYAVIFLYRCRSLEPFTRHLQNLHLLDILEVNSNEHDRNSSVVVKSDYCPQVLNVLKTYQDVKKKRQLLMLEFNTLGEYLYLLKACSIALSPLGNRALLYLAAAVSDFYIPKDKMPEHKIQSSDGPLQLSLEVVPKMLTPLVMEWVPNAFVISFKLETDPSLLISKSKQALDRYHHQVVIGNLLDTRKREVVSVTKDQENWIRLTDKELSLGVEIESKIVSEIVQKHRTFCSHD
ncbi:hypothetical protein CHS0354_017884 [Potamilus streckersoni]|uniref:Phosphopantothenate--cysteine ligase n=1 Tax=Potamilus streckersoni TaxID=2493646 RepID=A0AAE0T2M2_9BIVA|nr:hypothetical protein CHS0354_017884 [Potamilus streckersoni]